MTGRFREDTIDHLVDLDVGTDESGLGVNFPRNSIAGGSSGPFSDVGFRLEDPFSGDQEPALTVEIDCLRGLWATGYRRVTLYRTVRGHHRFGRADRVLATVVDDRLAVAVVVLCEDVATS